MKRFLAIAMIISDISFASQISVTNITVGGVSRSLYFYTPSSPPNNPMPVVMFLHGGTQNALSASDDDAVPSVLQTISNRDKFILIYGEGTTSDFSTNLWWNDCRENQGSPRSNSDDVSYIEHVFEWSKTLSDHKVDTNRFYVVGASSGGMMALRCAIEIPDVVASVASFIANMPTATNSVCLTPPDRATPMFICNGTNDEIMPWSGGEVKINKGSVTSIIATVQYWRNINQTTGAITQHLPNINTGDGSTNVQVTYYGGQQNSQVRFITTYGGGHAVPSTSVYVNIFPQNRDFEGMDAAWKFMRTFTLDHRVATGLSMPVGGDFDGDGVSDYATFWPQLAMWRVYLSNSSEWKTIQYGPSGSSPYAYDFDGDGMSDVGVVYTNSGSIHWAHFLSGGGGDQQFTFGVAGDIPCVADYDGDGIDDEAVYRPSSGAWLIYNSTIGLKTSYFGNVNMRPYPADYDGDGKADISVYDFTTHIWHYFGSSSGYSNSTFGSAGYVPVPGDYFGQGKSQMALFKSSTAQWVIRNPPNSDYTTTFGGSGWLAYPGEYSGGGTNKLGVFDKSTDNFWWISIL